MVFNQDSFGNSYWNLFSNLILENANCYLSNQIGSFQSELTANPSHFPDLIFNNNDGHNLRYLPQHPKEFLTLPATNTNYRFARNGSTGKPDINSSNTATLVSAQAGSAHTPYFNESTANVSHFAVSGQNSLTVLKATNSSGILSAFTGWSFGWLEDPLFQDDILYKFANTYAMVINNSAVTSIHRATQNNQTIVQPYLLSGDANYAVTCVSGSNTGSLKATNIAVIDNNANKRNPGTIPTNLLKGTGSFTIGGRYKILGVGTGGMANTNINNEEPIFLCIATYGTDYILKRSKSIGFN